MSEHTFKVGDVVRLVSGGPRMTVEYKRTDDLLSCVWFAGDAAVHEPFDPVTLVAVNSPAETFPGVHQSNLPVAA